MKRTKKARRDNLQLFAKHSLRNYTLRNGEKAGKRRSESNRGKSGGTEKGERMRKITYRAREQERRAHGNGLRRVFMSSPERREPEAR